MTFAPKERPRRLGGFPSATDKPELWNVCH
jgi:hypothetical protein